MAPPRKRSKRRRAPSAQPVRARPQSGAGKPKAAGTAGAGGVPAGDVRPPDGTTAPPAEVGRVPEVDGVDGRAPAEVGGVSEVDGVDGRAPAEVGRVGSGSAGEVDGPTLEEVDGPTLEEVDLVAGAPPEDLGRPTSTPPADLGIVTGELAPADDHDGVAADAGAVEPPPPRAGRGRSNADQLDEEDELLPAARNVKGRRPATVGGNRVAAFLRASWAELQRVQWPNRRQVGQATAVVLGFVVIAGGYLGLADLISSNLVDAIL